MEKKNKSDEEFKEEVPSNDPENQKIDKGEDPINNDGTKVKNEISKADEKEGREKNKNDSKGLEKNDDKEKAPKLTNINNEQNKEDSESDQTEKKVNQKKKNENPIEMEPPIPTNKEKDKPLIEEEKKDSEISSKKEQQELRKEEQQESNKEKEQKELSAEIPLSKKEKTSTEAKESPKDTIEEKKKEGWESKVIDESFGLKKLDESEINEIIRETSTRNPIINKMFEKLIRKCSNNFKLEENRISYEDYMKFFKEINRIIPKLKKKITSDVSHGSVFFVGDTHGSIEDTFYIIDFFLRIIKEKPEDKFLFVGDYVDRNPYDLQNLTLITAFYILFQDRVTLLRGNHEDRTINEYYGFYDNLLRRFYDKAEDLYEEIIQFFTHLPIAHISNMKNEDKKGARVFSVHGGIPIDPLNFNEPKILEEIEPELVCEVEKSELMDKLTVSMLWSDPDEYIEYIVTDDNNTGRMQFGRPILEQFLKANNLDVVVRGHQKWTEGIKVFFDYKLFSLFSTSKYDDRKKFNPKILQLEIGKAPNIIPINPSKMKEVSDEYLDKKEP